MESNKVEIKKQKEEIKEKKQYEFETYKRLTAPQRIQYSHFREHVKIDNYVQAQLGNGFYKNDRLMKMDTLYGSIQLGYNPMRGQSFIVANVKTSIFDTVPSRHQKEIKERQMMGIQKREGSNIAFASKRMKNSAILIYKKDTLPWSERTVKPYIKRLNMETLLKTMPFMNKSYEQKDKQEIKSQQRNLQMQLREKLEAKKYSEMASIRKQQLELLRRQNQVEALTYRKDTQKRLFFRKLNMVYDMQKHEMFEYYRAVILGGRAKEVEAQPSDGQNKEEQDD